MTSTAPLFAPIKRVCIPAVTTTVKIQDRRLSAKLALSNISLHTNSGQVIAVEKPYIQVKTSLSSKWRTLDNVDMEIERVSVDTQIFQHFEAIKEVLHCPRHPSARKHQITIRNLKTSSFYLSVNYSQMFSTGEFFRELTKQYERLRYIICTKYCSIEYGV